MVQHLPPLGSRLIGRTATHAHFSPHPALSGLIAHYTFTPPLPLARTEWDGYSTARAGVREQMTRSCEPGAVIHIVPDASGCIVGSFDGHKLEMILWGPTSRVVSMPNDLNDGPRRFYVEFLPHAEFLLFRMALNDVLDKVFSLDSVDGELARELEHGFERYYGNPVLFLAELDRLFLRRLDSGNGFSLFPEVIGLVRKTRGLLRVQEMAAATGYSARHLNRMCKEQAGMSLKLLSRLFRINAACVMMPGSPSLTELAHELGYHDQAHFIHDFRQICGVSPGEYLKKTSGFYNERWKDWAMDR